MNGTWVGKPENLDSPPVITSPNYTSWRNRTGYVAIRVPAAITGGYVYGWLRTIVSSDGEQCTITKLGLNPQVNNPIVARIDRPHLIYSADRFWENSNNDNTVENEITVTVNNASFIKTGALERGKHYTVENVPSGMIFRVNAINNNQVRIKLDGIIPGDVFSDWKAITNIKFTFLNASFNSNSEVEMRDFVFGLERVGKTIISTSVTNPVFNVGQNYTTPPGQFQPLPFTTQVSQATSTLQMQLYEPVLFLPEGTPDYPGVKLITFNSK